MELKNSVWKIGINQRTIQTCNKVVKERILEKAMFVLNLER